MGYSYYDYLKKYNAEFLSRYELRNHVAFGRKSNFLQLLNTKAALMLTNRALIIPKVRSKAFLYYFLAGYCIVGYYGIWYFQEIYNKYTHHKWTMYQPYMHSQLMKGTGGDDKFDPYEEKKPITRLNYQDSIKITYDGYDNPDIVSQKRFRYR